MTTTDVPALSGSGRSLLVRWLIAIVAFPIGGFIGHLIGGPAATVPAALISGLIAGAIIGAGQGIALGILRPQGLALWVGATSIGLGVALAAVTGDHRADRHDDGRHRARHDLGSCHRCRTGCLPGG